MTICQVPIDIIVIIVYNTSYQHKGDIMTDKAVAEHFSMPYRTYLRYKIADAGTWRKRIYYLMMEELMRFQKIKSELKNIEES